MRLNCPVKSIERRGNTWRVVAGKGRGKAHEFDAVISTVDALSLAQILDDAYALKIKERLYYPPVAVVTFGFERAQVAHPLDGFGMLIPEVEGRDILGTMFSSTLFENRAPADHVTIAVFVGGARHPQNALMPSADRRALVLRELKSLLGVSGQPVFEHENVWKRAIPQYEVGHSDVQVWAQAIERKHPGLVVGGNFVNAVAVPDLVAAAVGQADAITRGSV